MPNLRFTKNDAEALRDQLHVIGFAPENVRTLTNGSGGMNEPTKPNIENAVRNILGRAGKDDLVVVFLSGHGVQGLKGNEQKGVQIEGIPKEEGVQIIISGNNKINITRNTPIYLMGLDIFSADGEGIRVDGEAEVGILFCSIRDCKGDGIYNRANIFVEGSVITGNGNGFQSAGKSDVNNCRIAYNKKIGVTVSRNAKGRFSDNILFDNLGDNWRVLGSVH